MTAQTSEILESDHPSFRLGEWRVYGVIRGEPSRENHGWGTGKPYQAEAGHPSATNTANWKGYTEVFRLAREGRLVLLRFDYDEPSTPTRIVNETLVGDFYLVLKSNFEGPRLYVRFQGGVLADRGTWKHEQYTGASPIATELRAGCHPSFPRAAPLWHEIEFPPDTSRE
jgi:hypothetical protein